VAGSYALEFHLKLVGSVGTDDTFGVAFHPPGSEPGYEAVSTICPKDESPGGGDGASGPCAAGKTFITGGGFQPIDSTVSYRFTRTSAGQTQIIAQGSVTLDMNAALVVVYPSTG
jgi:hypothetical protein